MGSRELINQHFGPTNVVQLADRLEIYTYAFIRAMVHDGPREDFYVLVISRVRKYTECTLLFKSLRICPDLDKVSTFNVYCEF